MDIFIKSFNRPYYLERCLLSIGQFVRGEYKVTILDDGTPPEYLAKIQQLFPKVSIRKSDQYDEKVLAIKSHVPGKDSFSKTSIPTNLWRDAIKHGSPAFLLLEEDAWLVDVVDVDVMEATIKKFGLATLKLGWNGSAMLIQGKKIGLTDAVEQIIPSLPPVPNLIERSLLKNTFKVRSVLQRLGVLSPAFTLPYYSLYTITSAFFDKQYWLWIWDGAGTTLNEGAQLYRAVAHAKLRETISGKTVGEKVRTSFITSSVNRLKTVKFDMLGLHHQLNEAWLKGNLDPMQQFPRDFNVDYLKTFLTETPQFHLSEWDGWIAEFKGL